MESLSMILCTSLPIKNHSETLKHISFKPNFHEIHYPVVKKFSHQNNLSFLKSSLSFTALNLFSSLPSIATEALGSQTEQVSDKISLESILVSIDDFFNRNPFFVAGCTFIWLVVVPVTEEFLRKYKFTSAIDAFRKLQGNPEVQLLDIRDKKSLTALKSPNLKILNKSTLQVEFSEEDEEGFVKNVLEKFQDPANTILCILDNFGDQSMRVAELLFKSGFKEAYAIKGGVKGKKGWLSIQETLLPPSVHIYRKKKKKKAKIPELGINGVAQKNEDKNDTSSSIVLPTGESQTVENGHVGKSSIKSTPQMKIASSSPYPNYPDLRPPSSPTPSKP